MCEGVGRDRSIESSEWLACCGAASRVGDAGGARRNHYLDINLSIYRYFTKSRSRTVLHLYKMHRRSRALSVPYARALSVRAMSLLQRPQLAPVLVAHTNGRVGAGHGTCIGQRLE